MARGITLEDLTIGLLNYRYTGLTFQTLQDGTLRCVCFSLHDRSKLASCLHIGTIILIQCYISYTASNLRNSTVTIHPDHSPSCWVPMKMINICFQRSTHPSVNQKRMQSSMNSIKMVRMGWTSLLLEWVSTISSVDLLRILYYRCACSLFLWPTD